jgi:cell division transport system permease protein
MKLRKIRRKSRAWGRRQLYSFFSSLGTLWSHRLGTFMTVMVLGIAMALPLGLFVTVKNLGALDLQQEDWGTITVFLKSDATEDLALSFLQRINEKSDARAKAVSPGEGMNEFRESSGFGQVLDLFDENPLPWVLLVTPQPARGEKLDEVVAGLADWLGQQDQVDIVQVDHKWLQRLAGLLDLGNAFVTVLTFMFSLAVVVVVANTIRLDVAGRSEEIQVLSLVGAGNSFIRQPFLYSGFWYGLLGSLLALLLLNLSMYYLKYPLERLLASYGSAFTVKNLGAVDSLLVLLAGSFLGLSGAWVSVQRYLRQLRESGMLGRR